MFDGNVNVKSECQGGVMPRGKSRDKEFNKLMGRKKGYSEVNLNKFVGMVVNERQNDRVIVPDCENVSPNLNFESGSYLANKGKDKDKRSNRNSVKKSL